MLRTKLEAMTLDSKASRDTRMRLQTMLQNAGDLPTLDYEDDANDGALSTPINGSASSTSDEFAAVLNVAQERGRVQNLARAGCPTCLKLPTNPMLTACGHTFCMGCLVEMLVRARSNGLVQPECITCGAEISLGDLTPYGDKYAPLIGAKEPDKYDCKVFKKSRAKIISDTIDGWITGTGEVLHSSKTTAVASKILEIITETSDAKIICYTQFKPVIEILRRICDESDWKTQLFHGGMKREAAQKALDTFKADPECRILLASLKKGSTGLNLTEANHVIIVDPWFNSAIEQQAFARTYRLGQEKETHLWRVIVQNSIDAKLDEMQQQKEASIDSVMDPNNPHDNPRSFTKHDLFSLAGILGSRDGVDHMR